MCIAIYIPAGEDVTEEALELSYEHNPHGCGLAYKKQGEDKLVLYRDMKYPRFVKKFRKLQKRNPESPFFVHLRKKTHGLAVIENCHPFRIDSEHIFMHNGTIYPEVPVNKEGKLSDTRLLNDNILKHLPEGWMESDGVTRMIEEYIGRSRIAVMNIYGEVKLYNEELPGANGAAHWYEGVWYSNNYYKTPPIKATTHITKTLGGHTRARSLEDLTYIPEGATHVNSRGFASKWNADRTTLQSWDEVRREWRDWDNKDNWFKAIEHQRPIMNNYGKALCDSCKKSLVWYDINKYYDEWKNSHNLCEECAAAYDSCGMNLTAAFNKNYWGAAQ